MSSPVIAVTGSLLDAANGRPPRVAVNAAYLRAVEKAGGIPWLLAPGILPGTLAAVVGRCDGLLLTGGGDISPSRYQQPDDGSSGISEDRDSMEFAALALTLQRQMPLLAICRGLQVLNVHLGGSLHQDIPRDRPSKISHRQAAPRHEATHDVEIVPTSRLATALGATTVPTNSMHHQGIDRLAEGLCAAAHTRDGLIEAVELPAHPFAIGVQWHPEELTTSQDHARRLFEAFIQAASA